MRINDLTRSKGVGVVTVTSTQTVKELLAVLADHSIGAVVVSDDGGSAISGIVSERDVVRHLHRSGAEVLQAPVSEIMTREVTTCAPDADVESLARQMTELRVRHLPVVKDGRLFAIVSIGDIVKARIVELQDERDHLVEYIQQ